jgi:hypothetical protein
MKTTINNVMAVLLDSPGHDGHFKRFTAKNLHTKYKRNHGQKVSSSLSDVPFLLSADVIIRRPTSGMITSPRSGHSLGEITSEYYTTRGRRCPIGTRSENMV